MMSYWWVKGDFATIYRQPCSHEMTMMTNCDAFVIHLPNHHVNWTLSCSLFPWMYVLIQLFCHYVLSVIEIKLSSFKFQAVIILGYTCRKSSLVWILIRNSNTIVLMRCNPVTIYWQPCKQGLAMMTTVMHHCSKLFPLPFLPWNFVITVFPIKYWHPLHHNLHLTYSHQILKT